MSNIIQLQNAARIYGSADEIVAEVVTITPQDATAWLRANCKNRPVRKRHVLFLAEQMKAGRWQVNGQAIVIADNENVLDGQHRLLAIIEAGMPISSLVVYGIREEAFATIDTGAVRTSADALWLHYSDWTQQVVKAVATAVPWLVLIQRGTLHRGNLKLSNGEVIDFARRHQSLFERADTICHYAKENRPLSAGVGTALFEMFARKDEEKAAKFFRDVYTGEHLQRTDVEYVLRTTFQRDAQRITSKLPAHIKVRMTIKAWNWRRRGMMEASHQTISVYPNEDQRQIIL